MVSSISGMCLATAQPDGEPSSVMRPPGSDSRRRADRRRRHQPRRPCCRGRMHSSLRAALHDSITAAESALLPARGSRQCGCGRRLGAELSTRFRLPFVDQAGAAAPRARPASTSSRMSPIIQEHSRLRVCSAAARRRRPGLGLAGKRSPARGVVRGNSRSRRAGRSDSAAERLRFSSARPPRKKPSATPGWLVMTMMRKTPWRRAKRSPPRPGSTRRICAGSTL